MLKQRYKANSQVRRVRPAVFVAWFCFILQIAVFIPVFEAKAAQKPRYASLIIDAETGEILHQSGANTVVHPASLTKMMTLMMVFDALKRGRIGLNDRIRISQHAASMVPSKLGLKPGSTIRIEDAILALVTKSANDIAVAVAEHLGKTESNFARLMTRAAQKRGMTKTVFKNASGLHDPEQVTTAADMARLAHILIYDYGQYYHYFSRSSFTYQGKTYKNHNHLMDTYRGMDGLKTGFIQASGFNLVASAVRGERRLIGVVFGGRTAKARNQKMEELLNTAFAKFGAYESADHRTPLPPRKPGDFTDSAVRYAGTSKSEALENLLEPDAAAPADRWAALYGPGSRLSQMIGEGDDDPQFRKRIETGLISISAVTGAAIPEDVFRSEISAGTPAAVPATIQRPVTKTPAPQTQNVSRPILKSGLDWSIQIGAFANRERTDSAIAASIRKLPESLRSASAVVAPLKTAEGWIYRGRLSGYSQETAYKACTYLEECIPIPPETP